MMNARTLALAGLYLAHVPVSRGQDAVPVAEPLWPGPPPAFMAHDEPEAASDSGNDPRYRNRHLRNVVTPDITIYPPKTRVRTDLAVIVCPGGGYNILAIDKEGHDVALWLNRMGITAAVLKYRTRPFVDAEDVFPPLYDLKRAIRMVRSRAGSLEVSPHKIGVMGFSAGGHLALLAGLRHDAGDPQAADPVERVGSRPDFLMPIYPGIPSEHLDQLGPEMPPLFIAIAWDDFLMEENIRFLEAAHRVRVPLEFHILPYGGHGYGLGVSGGPPARWPDLCARWLRDEIIPMPSYQPPVTRPVPAEEGFRLRINFGRARAWQDEDGYVWKGDWTVAIDGSVADRGDLAVEAPRADRVYATERYNVTRCRIPVSNGVYQVRLHFAETYDGIQTEGQRVFGVSLQGKPVLAQFDPFAEAGGRRNRAVVKSFEVTVDDGALTLEFDRGTESPLINGIVVLGAEGG